MGRSISPRNVKVIMDDGDTSTLDIHQGPTNDRILLLSGEVKEQTIATIIAQIIALDGQNPNAPIQLIINTIGGSIDEMFALYDTMKFVRAPIHTIGLGKIMSAGTLLLASGQKGKRMISKNSHVMFHPLSGGAMGNIFEVMNEVEEMKLLQQKMDDCFMLETGLSSKDYKKLMGCGRDVYMDAARAVSLGFADKIIPNKL